MSDTGQFDEVVVPLKFCLGELCIHVSRIPAWRLRRNFLEPLPTPFQPAEWLAELPAHCEAVVVPGVPAAGILPGLRFVAGAIRYVPAVTPRYYVEVDGPFEEFLQKKFSRKTRYNLTRSVKRFAEQNGGQLDVRLYKTPEEMEEFYALAGEISRRTYQHRLLNVGLSSDEQHIARAKEMARQDKRRDYVLALGGRPVAFAQCTVHGDCLAYEVIGYDPEFSSWSPGNVLLMRILQDIFEEGQVRVFDFGPGEGQYKAMFSTHHAVVADVFFFRRRLRSVVFSSSHYVLDRVSAAAGRLLARLGLKERIRKWFRRF